MVVEPFSVREKSGKRQRRDNQLLLTLRPKFVFLLIIIPVIPFSLFLTIWGGLFFGGFFVFFNILTGFLGSFCCASIVFIILGPVVYALIVKNSYNKTRYDFYTTRLDYFEGFIAIEEKTIRYKNITEVNLRKSFLQRMFGLGTIILSTPATGFSESGRSRSGIKITDIESPDEIYRFVKELVERESLS